MTGHRDSGSRRGRRAERGFAVPEFVAGVGLLLLPVAMLVTLLPVWAEVRSMGRVAAQQAARAAAVEVDDAAAAAAATDAARTVAVNHGRHLAGPVRVDGTVEGRPGTSQALVAAAVPVRMPVLALPFVGEVGGVVWTARSVQPVDVYRSVP